jgi:hypothetical protein
MRDELRQQLIDAIDDKLQQRSFDMPWVSGSPGQWVIAVLEVFLRETGLKIMAEPIKDQRHYLAKKWWEAAPLMPRAKPPKEKGDG